MELLAPDEYFALTPEQKAAICNGCGPADCWKARLVPDELLGVDFTACCDAHDYMYWLGRDKDQADVWLLANMAAACVAEHASGLLADIKLEALLWACHVFFLAVQRHGGPYFGKAR